MLKTGIVIQINSKNILILTGENEYLILQKPYGIQPALGEEYTGYLYKKKSFILKIFITFILLALIGSSTYFLYKLNYTQYNIVLDLGASIQLKINGYGNVIDYSILNDNAEKIIEAVDIKNKSYSDALFIIYSVAEKNNYLDSYRDSKDKYISVYVTNHKNIIVDLTKFKSKVLADKIQININDNGIEK